MQAKPSDLGSRGREVLRFGLAGHCQLDPLRVSIERVLGPTAKRQALVVLVFVQVGGDVVKGDRLVQAAKVGCQLGVVWMCGWVLCGCLGGGGEQGKKAM